MVCALGRIFGRMGNNRGLGAHLGHARVVTDAKCEKRETRSNASSEGLASRDEMVNMVMSTSNATLSTHQSFSSLMPRAQVLCYKPLTAIARVRRVFGGPGRVREEGSIEPERGGRKMGLDTKWTSP
jgi:hypothetical protein